MAGAPAWRRWVALSALALAQLMIAIDALIMLIALPVLQADLGIAQADGQWVVTIYALPFGALLLLGGRIGDYNGRKRAFLIGWGGFIVASAVGGLAPDATTLFAARAAQGAFAALLIPAALATISITFTEQKERARAFAVYGAVSGIGLALGMILGGLITEYTTWRWCLLVNVPVGAVAFLVAIWFLDESKLVGRPRYDVAGTVTAGAGLGSLVYGFVHAAESGWNDRTTVLFIAAAVALLIAFGYIESRVSNPLLPLHLLSRVRVGAILGMALLFSGVYGGFLYMIYFLQLVKNYSALECGMALLPYAAAAGIAAIIFEQRIARARPIIPIVVGLVLAGTCMSIIGTIDTSWGYTTHLLLPVSIMGVGVITAYVAITTATLAHTADDDAGVVSAVLNAALQVGSALGPAVVTPIAIRLTESSADGAPPGPADLTNGFGAAILTSGAIILLGAVIAGLVIRKPVPIAVPVQPIMPTLASPTEALPAPLLTRSVTTAYTTRQAPDGRRIAVRTVTTTVTSVEHTVVGEDKLMVARL